MYSQSEIEDAVTAGALDPTQAASLRAFVATRNRTPTTDEEYYGLYRGFNDWYVFYTVLLVLIAVGWLGSLIPVGSGGRGMGAGGAPIAAPLFVAAASWGLAELFSRRRHTALASVTLAFTFGLGVLLTLIFILAPVMDGGGPANSVIGSLCCFAAAGASYAYWLRFRSPASQLVIVGLGVLGIIALIGGLLGSSQSGLDVVNVVAFLLGIATFAYAMWWDGSDPWRITERNESGLWLHGLASVLLVFPIVYFVGLYRGVASTGGALIFLLLFLVFALLALAVNRKVYLLTAVSPLLVALNVLIPGDRGRGYQAYDAYGSSGGAYPGGGYGSPMSAYGPSNPLAALGGTVATLLIVSLLLLALAIWWAPLRRIVSGILPASVRARAPVIYEAPQPYAPPPPMAPPPPQPPVV